MESSGRAPGYDLFKLIVAVFLLILFFVLMNRRSTPQALAPISTLSPAPAPRENTNTPSAKPTDLPSWTSTAAIRSPTATNNSQATLTAVPAATGTSVVILTPTPPPPPTATNTSEATATPLPIPMATPAVASTVIPAESTPGLSACDSASSRSRLQIGGQAVILRRLNFRSSPGIQNNWLSTNQPGTKVEVMGGPQCLPHHTGAYVWWQIKLPDGQIGWSAEGSQFGSFYFMEPE